MSNGKLSDWKMDWTLARKSKETFPLMVEDISTMKKYRDALYAYHSSIKDTNKKALLDREIASVRLWLVKQNAHLLRGEHQPNLDSNK